MGRTTATAAKVAEVPRTVGELRQRLEQLPDEAQLGQAGIRPLGLYFVEAGSEHEQAQLREQIGRIVARVQRRKQGAGSREQKAEVRS